MDRSGRMAWMLVGLALTVAALATAAMGTGQDLKIGVVDIDRIFKDAPRLKQYNDELNAFDAALKGKIDIRNQNMMLDENEVRELIDLKTKDNQTDKEKARIKELEDAERARDAELKTLTETKELDDTKKARLKQLQDMQAKSKTAGEEIAKDYGGQLQSKMQDLNTKAEAEVKDAIKKVAEAKGFTMVMASNTVLFGGTDVTDEVIAKLDRKL